MRLAQPIPKLTPAPRAHFLLGHIRLEILRAHPARVELGEQSHEAGDFGLLGGCGGLWVRRCDGVEEGPAAAAEGCDVGGAVFGWGSGEGGGLGGECCEGVAGAAAGGNWVSNWAVGRLGW